MVVIFKIRVIKNETQKANNRMAAYLKKAKGLLETFLIASIEVFLEIQECDADTLAKLALKSDSKIVGCNVRTVPG